MRKGDIRNKGIREGEDEAGRDAVRIVADNAAREESGWLRKSDIRNKRTREGEDEAGWYALQTPLTTPHEKNLDGVR